MATLQQGLANLRSGDFSYANKYEAEISFPAVVNNSEMRNLSIRCDTISIPGRNLRTVMNGNIYGPPHEIVQGYTFGEVSASFYLSNDMRELRLFYEWQDSIVDTETFDLNYYKETVGTVRIFSLDLVIMFQFLEAATRKMVTCNAMVNAKNGMNTWQTIRRLNRLFCGQRVVSAYDAKPPSGDFTMPVLCSLPYVQERLKTQLPSQLRRTMAERYLTTHIPRCRTSEDISDCIAELARIMESNSRNIILNYTNFVLNSRICLKTPIEKEEGVLKDGLMDFIATRAEPHMLLHKFDHVMEKMKQAWSDISREEIGRLSNAFQRARENQEKYWETRFSEHVQALDDLCSNSSSSSSSSSAENLSLLQCAKELVECWKTRM